MELNKIFTKPVIVLMGILFLMWAWTIWGEFGEQRDIKIKNRFENNQVEVLG